MKRKALCIISLVMVAAVAMIFTSCGSSSDSSSSSDSGKTVIHFGSTVATTNAWYRAGKTLEKDLEAADDTIDLQLDFGGVHGSDKDEAEAVQNGSLEMYIGSTVGGDSVVPKIGFINLPYLFTSYDEVDNNIYDEDGWAGKILKKDYQEAGFHVFGFTDCDFRWLTNSVRPIRSKADMKGMKMRVPESPMFLKFFKNLGCTPTSMGITEVASALQQKTIDGQDNGPILTYTYGFYKFNKYVTMSNHSYAAAAVVYNKDKWNSLTASQKKNLTKYVGEYIERVKKLNRSDTEKFTKKMKQSCQVIGVTKQLDSDMRAAAKDVWNDNSITKNFDQTAMKKIRSME